jgi:uncharacterized protein YndB with AHSA1/START domain
MGATITVERSIWIRAAREKVWQAITDAEQLGQWYAPGCAWEIPALRVGEEIRFHNTEDDIQIATIQVVDTPHRLVLRWQADPGNPDAALDNTFTLVEEDGGTRVTVTQSGYETLPETARRAWADADGGAYTTVVENLKAYLENH